MDQFAFRKKLSQILQEKMTYHKLTAEQVALGANVSTSTIKNFLEGGTSPRPDILIRLARFLQFDLNQFVLWEDKKETSALG